MKHTYTKQVSVMRQLTEMNKKKVRIAKQITALLDKLSEVSAECGKLCAQLDEHPPSKN